MSADDGAADTLRDEELAATHDDVLEVKMRDRLKELHTALPGIIQSFDPATQTAVVQPALNRIWIPADDGSGGGSIPIPLCSNVPVQFPGGHFGLLTWPVTARDECLLVFAERAIDNWWANGGKQDPAEFRMHDYSDGFALLGFSSVPNVPKNISTTAIELRTFDGGTAVRVENGMVTAGDVAAAVAAVRADIMNEIIRLIEGHTHPFVGVVAGTACSGTTTPSTELDGLPDPSAKNVKVS